MADAAAVGPVQARPNCGNLTPAAPTHPHSIAVGLKNAYASTFDSAGRLWRTDVQTIANLPDMAELHSSVDLMA